MSNTTGLKTGGRTKGTPNRTTTEIREQFQLLINNNLKTLQSDLKALEPKDRIKSIIELSKFVIPTLKAQDLILGKDLQIEPITFTIYNLDKKESVSNNK